MTPRSPGRRGFVGFAGGLGAAAAIARPSFGAGADGPGSPGSGVPGPRPAELVAAPASARLVGDLAGPTPVWAFNGTVPGPLLRLKRDEVLDVELVNRLPDPTTIHWHGLRVPNAMDGVPHLTQPPVEPGGRFRYRFACPDSGTYWYHPHAGAPEQVDRGLYAALVVEDVDPPPVDREIVWVLDDWRLTREARIVEDFYAFFDVAHAGRVGNTVTVNGRLGDAEAVRAGERVRLRIVNVANARIFALRFEGHRPWLLALDGQPLPRPRRLEPDEPVLVGPGMRTDLVLDCDGEPGARYRVVDGFVRSNAYRVLDLAYATGGPVRAARREPPRAPAPNPLAEPEPGRDPLRVELRLGGGAMGGTRPPDPPQEREARRARRLAGSREADPAWSVNGHAHLHHGHGHPFEFTVERGRTVVLTMRNDTAWWHPMHLHGHTYRELERDGRPVDGRPWRDTSLMAPRETLQVAFVADNPGDWILHCHVLEHHAGGLGAQFRVL